MTARAGWREQPLPPDSDSFGDFTDYNRPGLAGLLRACHLDVVYTAADGDHLFRADGTRVLDLVGGFGAALFGHNHPALVRAATATLNQQVPFVAQGSVRPGAARLARRPSESVGACTGREYVVTFGSTGADAVEAAIRHATVAHARALSELDAELRRTLRRLRRDHLHDVRPSAPAGDAEARTAAAVVTESLDRIARLRASFTFVTSGDTMHRAKPRLEFYRELLDQLGAVAADCVMVGNDPAHDGPAAQLGIPVFLVGAPATDIPPAVARTGLVTTGDHRALRRWLGIEEDPCSSS
ncbi:aminotransferase class III-fold pyridoxal phosphate-dependent enzyme [Nocardia exalbida]|uniref:aminotransferase class III-fold pyridoxal phosphate-dependent enzyme n=1 Tax=Nocardia exalbida TaxID=290231 RepID=UPI0002EBD610|nr:aminotransferase class III-fold pyridoxal phosphate-dependent enzyme [Nocardia exalbida]